VLLVQFWVKILWDKLLLDPSLTYEFISFRFVFTLSVIRLWYVAIVYYHIYILSVRQKIWLVINRELLKWRAQPLLIAKLISEWFSRIACSVGKFCAINCFKIFKIDFTVCGIVFGRYIILNYKIISCVHNLFGGFIQQLSYRHKLMVFDFVWHIFD